MVQVLKETVRVKIVNAAEVHFARSGFRKATIKDIAQEANVSIGNVYKYYPNKKSLFEAIITPEFVEKFSRLTRNRISAFEISQKEHSPHPYLDNEAGELLHFLIENRLKAVILLARSAGTKYEDFSQQYVEAMVAQAIDRISEQHPQLEISPLLQFMLKKVLTNSVRGIVSTLEHFEDSESISECFAAATTYHLGGITALIEWAAGNSNP